MRSLKANVASLVQAALGVAATTMITTGAQAQSATAAGPPPPAAPATPPAKQSDPKATDQRQLDPSGTPVPQQSTPVPQPSTVAALPDQTAAPPPDPYKKFEKLGIRGWSTPYPKVVDTVTRDVGGYRSALADAGIGVNVFSLDSLNYNLLQNDGHYRGPQVYNGQKLTVPTATTIFITTYDLSHVGLEGGQLIGVMGLTANGFQARNGPRDVRIQNLGYFQSLFNDKVELKIGYFTNQNDYIGVFVGGNFAGGGLGPQATIPFQVGMSYGTFGTPEANIKVNLGNHMYDHFGIQRSESVGGGLEEEKRNGLGLRFAPPGTKPLFINEFGYQIASSKGQKSIWLRGGGIYNTTNYTSFRTGQPVDNWALYFLADKQLTQPDDSLPFRGIYAGASINYAPPGPNLYSRYAEARIYSIGPFANRPFDLASFVATYNGYSRYARRALTVPGSGNYKATLTAIGSYTYHLGPGLYAQPGLGVTVHPSVAPRFNTALNAYFSVTVLL